jgi:molecular chaperone GrpE
MVREEADLTEQDRKETNASNRGEPAIEPRHPTAPQVVSGPELKESGSEMGPDRQPQVDPLESAQKEAAHNRDNWIRAVADLENYKKRAIQERSNLLKYRNEELLRDLLTVIDNLERALQHSGKEEKAHALTEGVAMTAKMFADILKKYGVTEIKAIGKDFDPHVHEAIMRVPVAEGGKTNQVVEEVEKGYMYQDRLLRPAKVVVSTGA